MENCELCALLSNCLWAPSFLQEPTPSSPTCPPAHPHLGSQLTLPWKRRSWSSSPQCYPKPDQAPYSQNRTLTQFSWQGPERVRRGGSLPACHCCCSFNSLRSQPPQARPVCSGSALTHTGPASALGLTLAQLLVFGFHPQHFPDSPPVPGICTQVGG